MNITEKTVDLSLGKARYLEAGAAGDGVPLLMLHGTGISNSAETFDTIIPLLAQRHRVLSLDHLGYGKYNRQLEEGPTFELMVEHVREFMDAMHIARARVVAHSMGGWVASLLAYQSPNRVAHLALISAAGLNRQAAPSVGAVPKIPTLEEIVVQVRGDFRNPSAATDELVARIATTQHEMITRPNAQHSIDPLVRLMLTPSLRSRYMMHRRLPHIAVPALVIWGTGDVMDPYPTWSGEYDELKGDMRRSSKPWTIPGARYVRFDTGHYPHWEQPQQVANLLEDFFGS